MHIHILDPTDFPHWNRRIAELPGASIFHTADWARVLIDAYSYRPMYCTAFEGRQIAGCIPVMEIDSCLTGRRGVGLPYSDVCDAIGHDPEVLDLLYDRLTWVARIRRWRYLEIRGQGVPALDETAPSRTYLVHVLNLTPDAPMLYRKFRSSNRRNIQKATLHPIELHHRTTGPAVCQFYHLNCTTRKGHGLPPQPLKFFKALHRHILTNGLGFVTLARYEGRPIAGAVFLHFQDEVVYKYGASEKAFQHLRPNNLIMWDAIRWAKENGFSRFHFGRTNLHHRGLRRFKQSWHPVESTLQYHTHTFLHWRLKTPAPRTGYPLLTRLPQPLLNLAGALFYRHMG